jgi:hypothetical protein
MMLDFYCQISFCLPHKASWGSFLQIMTMERLVHDCNQVNKPVENKNDEWQSAWSDDL